MVAVTIGVAGRTDRAAATSAATRCEPHANLRLLVLGEDQFRASGLPDPSFLVFRLFELVDDDDVLFLGSDLLCLRAWDPPHSAATTPVRFACATDSLQACGTIAMSGGSHPRSTSARPCC